MPGRNYSNGCNSEPYEEEDYPSSTNHIQSSLHIVSGRRGLFKLRVSYGDDGDCPSTSEMNHDIRQESKNEASVMFDRMVSGLVVSLTLGDIIF